MLMGEYQDPLPSHLNIVVAMVTYFYSLSLVRHFNQCVYSGVS